MLHVDGLPVTPGEWQTPLPVRPGTVQISLETAPGAIERRTIEVGAGQATSVIVGMPPQQRARALPVPLSPLGLLRAEPVPARPAQAIRVHEPVPPLRIAGYIVGGTGALGLVAFGVLGALSRAAFEELEERCPVKSRCDPSLSSLASRGELEQTAANLSLAVGLSALSAGVVLFMLGEPGRESMVAVSPTDVRVRGAF